MQVLGFEQDTKRMCKRIFRLDAKNSLHPLPTSAFQAPIIVPYLMQQYSVSLIVIFSIGTQPQAAVNFTVAQQPIIAIAEVIAN